MADEVEAAFRGDRRALARVLSDIENGTLSIKNILDGQPSIEKNQWSSMAITGAPGVGKSVLVDRFIAIKQMIQ